MTNNNNCNCDDGYIVPPCYNAVTGLLDNVLMPCPRNCNDVDSDEE